MTDPKTIKIYDERAQEYADLLEESVGQDPNLTAFIASLPKNARVLDLGCGPGDASAIMVAAGLKVDAVDASTGMIELASRHPGVSARQMSFEDISGTDIYDGVWASFSLLHARKSAFPSHLSALHAALVSGGKLALGMKLGHGDGPDRIGRYYAYYTKDELDMHLTNAGFSPTDHVADVTTGLDGSPAETIVIFADA